jgi:hypothetical protein
VRQLSQSIVLLCLAALPARAQTALFSVDGSAPNQQLGTSLVEIGDVDGDGIADLAIGAPGDSTSGNFTGAVQIRSGASGALLSTSYGPQPNGQLGLVVKAVGDVDGDGTPDFGVPRLSSIVGVGHVRIYSGADGSLLRDWAGTTTNFGIAIDGIGDLDGDGHADVLVGISDAPPQNAGAVQVLSGASGAVLRSYNSPLPGEQLGSRVSRIDDTEGDGVPDILAGTNSSGPFAARVIAGNNGSLRYAVPSSAGWSTATSVAGGADVDGDGFGDFVLGFPFANGGQGFARTYSGVSGALLGTLAACDGLELGFGVSALGDVDGDGHPDFGVLESGGHRGRVFSSTGTQLRDLPCWNLTSLERTTDRNGDGHADLLLGRGQASASSIQCGRAEIVLDDVFAPSGTPQTFGNGSGIPCPCGNNAVGQVGCANSLGVGASLRGFGQPSLLNRSLNAVSTDIPLGHLAVFFSGAQNLNGGLGAALGDGLRGIGGALDRLQTRAPCTNPCVWRAGMLGGGTWIVGQTFYAQLWYRDLGGPCGTGSNLSNAVSFTALP